MVQPSTVCVGSVLFSTGLLLGLIVHLPGTSTPGHFRSDASTPGHFRSADGGALREQSRTRRELLRRWSFRNVTDRVPVAGVLGNGDGGAASGDKAASLIVSSTVNIATGSDGSRSQNNDNNINNMTNSLPHRRQIGTNSSRPENIRLDSATNAARTVTVVLRRGDERSGDEPGGDEKTGDETGGDERSGDERAPGPIGSAGSGLVLNGIYWSEAAESLAPPGFGDPEVAAWRRTVDGAEVVALSAGCGRMQNRLVQFADGAKACARYRLNADQIQGEIYSSYLARALGIGQVLPSVLQLPDPRDDRWRRAQRALAQAQWAPDRPVILTPWLDGLQPEYIPPELRTDAGSLHPTDDVMRSWTPDRVRALVQWSDLIVFDYLTANLDRVVNNLYNRKWNPAMMDSPTHNLERTPEAGLLIFLDNESGLFHSYRLLDKYGHFHGSLLRSLCVFRRRTAERIRKFADDGDIGEVIMTLFRSEEPLHGHVHRIPDMTTAILNKRLRDVADQVTWCESRYGR